MVKLFNKLLVPIKKYVNLGCRIYCETSPCTPPECPPVYEGHHLIRTWFLKFSMWVYSKTIQWHIHAGSWSLVNCLAGSLDEALYRVLMNINECGCRPYGWLGLDGNRCIRVIPRHPPFFVKKRLCLHAKKLLLEIYYGP